MTTRPETPIEAELKMLVSHKMNSEAYRPGNRNISSHTNVSLRRPGFALWFWWVLATAAASTIAWAITAGSGFFTLGLSLILGGSITGFFVGGAQTLVLLRYSENFVNRGQAIDWEQPFDLRWYWDRLRWAAFTTLGGTAAFMMMLPLQIISLSFGTALWRETIGPAIIFSLAGTVYGYFQCVVLREVSQNAAWWIPANGVGWGISALIGMSVDDRLRDMAVPRYEPGIIMGPGDFLWVFVAGNVGTTMVSVLTGVVLIWILQKYQHS
jgi:hypothetical protein